MRIENLTPTLTPSYEEYLLSKEISLFYYSSKYKNFVKRLLGCEEEYLLAVERDKIMGILPLMYIQVSSFRVYNSLPYYGSNGGIIADNEEAYSKLLKTYNEIARDKTTLSSTVITNPFNEQDSSGFVHNYIDHRIGQITSLSSERDDWKELQRCIDSSAGRNVKKALRENISVEVDHCQLNRLRKMHQENIQAMGGIPKSDEFFTLIPQHFSPNKDFDLYVAKKDGVIIAGLLIFYFNQTVEYFTPAIDDEYRSYQPLSLIIMTAMTEAAKRGFRWWNWGGTWESQVGVYRFKRKWGAQERKYFYYTQLNDPSILTWPREKISETFQNFFIVPFSALEREEKRS
jgi:lipid II:glycine glycyltransferase (peptidoglycan interpeptide bridge formation enzyme)